MRRKPQEDEPILQYKTLKTAAGGSGRGGGRGTRNGGGNGGFRAGDNVVCRVIEAEPGGYAILAVKTGSPGFLPTQARLKVGDEILAQFVCAHNKRLLFSARFSKASPAANQEPES